MMELPTISKTSYGDSTRSLSAHDMIMGNVRPAALGGGKVFEEDVGLSGFGDLMKVGERARVAAQHQLHRPIILKENFVSRIVRVFIADPNENIPLDKRIIYKSEEFHTDLTDQELFFEANPAALLAAHNEYRVTVMDKKLSSQQREVKLEPARIRDLKMVVVDVAVF